MAARTRKVSTASDVEIIEPGNDIQTLHAMLRIIGDQLTIKDVKLLKFIYAGQIPVELGSKASDGFDFLLIMERIGLIDDTNYKHLRHLLKVLGRHDLLHFIRLGKRRTVQSDPFDDYLERNTYSTLLPSRKRKLCNDDEPENSQLESSQNPDLEQESTPEFHSRQEEPCQSRSSSSPVSNTESIDNPSAVTGSLEPGIKKKQTCDIRLRVRAEYCNHDTALSGNIHSNKPELIERQFEKFAQANTILRSRDLGAIICDIKFSELTYLNAFWRDYVNGSLQEALKTVFITESLKQAVGEEAIKLLVNVDEDDYDAGRLILLQNLQDS